MFKDAMKQSWPWWIQKEDLSNWHDETIIIPLRRDGYPKEIPYNGHVVHTAVLMHMDPEGPLYPKGEYKLRYRGKGKLFIYGDTEEKIISESDTEHSIFVRPSKEGIHITILESDKENPVRDIRIMMPGFQLDDKDPFHPDFIEHIREFSVIRFMKTNYVEEFGSVSWDDRSIPTYQTQSKMDIGGLCHEYIIMLCNKYDKNPWINVPTESDDDYVRELAEFYHRNLKKDLMLYIEYTNEPWNPMFPAYEYGIREGERLGLSKGEEANARFNVKRTLEMRDIFRSVYGDEYLQRVTWSISTWSHRKIISEYIFDELRKRKGQVEALAIAPYFAGEIANQIGDGNRYTIDEIFTMMDYELDNEMKNQIRYYKKLASEENMRLITYEAGQHFVSLFYPKNDILKKQMEIVNGDPRIKDLYIKYINLWKDEAGDLIVFFNLVEEVNDYGDFGMKRHYQSKTIPKWDAVKIILNEIRGGNNE
jgi:hypothetical protein